MLLTDKLKEGRLLVAVGAVEPFPFLIGNEDVLEMLLDTRHGDRQLFSKMENKTIEEIADMIALFYKKKWLELVKISEIDIEAGTGDIRTITEKIDNEEKRTNENELLQKVSAFNDDDLVTDTGSNGTGKDDLKGKVDRVLTDTQINLSNAYNNLSLIEKNNIIDRVLTDVAHLITLSIY